MHVNNGTSQSSFSDASVSVEVSTIGIHVILSDLKSNSFSSGKDTDSISSTSYERNALIPDKGPNVAQENSEASNFDMDSSAVSKPTMDCSPGCVRPLLQNQQLKSFEPSSSFQGSPCEGRHFRSNNDEADTEETSTSGQQDYICHNDILEWAKANNHGSLQIICEYYKLDCPPRGSTITFHPLEHLYPLEFHRPDDERLMHISGSPLDLRSCKTMLERAEVLNALIAEEEATTLSAWAISRICVSLRLEHGILSASVLSLIPLIRPYQWQSLLMPVLPNDMLDFLEAPVPYIVSQLSKESFIDSFPSCDRPFMKFFVDTQMFSVYTDLVLFVNQKD